MSRTIRVDNDVYDGLKTLADPFEDTPNTVIRRLLEQHGTINKSSVKAEPVKRKKVTLPKSGGLTTQHEYEDFLVSTLWYKFQGRASKPEVTEATIKAMEDAVILGGPDYEKVSSGETKAENTIAWGRNRLKEHGIISGCSPRGIWELTEEGIAMAKRLGTPPPHL